MALRLSILTIWKTHLRHPAEVDSFGNLMKRRSGKPIVDLDRKPAVVHFNVGSGYLSYIEQDGSGDAPRVKSVVIARETR
jgi:hypothetical protein